MTSIDFTLEKNGQVIFHQKLESVVTDDDPEYTGGKIGDEYEFMRVATHDSLREVIKKLMEKIHESIS